MKNLIKILFILVLTTTIGCSKEPTYNKFIGEWASEQDNPNPKGMNTIYTGFFEDTTTSVRRISYDFDMLNIIISDAPFIIISAHVNDDYLIYRDYIIEGGDSTATCSKTKMYFFNVKSKIENDTLYETGEYIVYLDGKEVSQEYTNSYSAKFIKRNNSALKSSNKNQFQFPSEKSKWLN